MKKLAILSLVIAVSCSTSGGNDGPPVASDAGSAGEAGESSGVGGSGGSSGTGSETGGSSGTDPQCVESCDDGFDCTIDRCRAGRCAHFVRPVSCGFECERDSGCPSGEYCTVEDGCVRAPACATVSDCIEAWADDPCRTNIQCDSTSAACLSDLLDQDGDGYAPVGCGGDDCDDDAEGIRPGAFEECNGRDDDCDGQVDDEDGEIDGEAVLPCGNAATCMGGECVCDPGNLCGTDCADFDTDARHCGGCGNACEGGLCVGGECTCEDDEGDGRDVPVPCPLSTGGTECIDLAVDNENCGECGRACELRDTCVAGECKRDCWFTLNGVALECASDEICILYSGLPQCVPDPCPGESLLDCEACAIAACPQGSMECTQHGPSSISCR